MAQVSEKYHCFFIQFNLVHYLIMVMLMDHGPSVLGVTRHQWKYENGISDR